MSNAAPRTTKTGGRNATTRHISPKLALAVGLPASAAPRGWRWSPLTEIARLESGHTPSRRHAEYWRGTIPWISIGDAKKHHGNQIDVTEEQTNELGIQNSSARVLPERTVCLSRTASVGYVVVMGRPMATSQDFVNWVCTEHLDPFFLKYLLVAEGPDLLRFASGSVHQTIYFPEAKAFHICHPSVREQRRIVAILDEAFAGIAAAKANAEKSLHNAREVSGSISQQILDSVGGHEFSLESVAAEDCSLSYGIVQPGDDVEGGLPIVRPVDLTREIITLDGLKHINPELATSYQRTRLQGGELLLCVRGTTGTVSVAAPELKGANVTRGIVPIRFNLERVAPAFGYHLMKSAGVQSQIRERTYGTALMQINIGDLRSISVRIPPLTQQHELAERLDTVAKEARRLESLYTRKLAALDELKQSLLQQAFSGQL